MTYDDLTIIELARLIKDNRKWENLCGGCKHLGNSKWHFVDREGNTHYCNHPNRQSGFSDPRPYGCGGYCFERK